jgi:hypothetical protein
MNRSVHIVLLATVLLGSFLRVLGSEVVRPVLRGGGMTAVGVRREPARKLNLNSLSAPHSHVMIDSSRAIHGYDDMNVEEEEEVDEDEEDAEQERMLSIFYSASYYGHAAEIKTEAPSRAPTPKPSSEPTQMPSAESFAEPVVERTPQATPKPSNPEPTPHPSEESTPEPTPEPSEAPTPELTPEPSKAPTSKPSRAPSSNPTSYPSARPTVQPSVKPTRRPTLSPTTVPTAPAPFFGIDMEFVSSELKVRMLHMISILASIQSCCIKHNTMVVCIGHHGLHVPFASCTGGVERHRHIRHGDYSQLLVRHRCLGQEDVLLLPTSK